jgi:uncharacterized protein
MIKKSNANLVKRTIYPQIINWLSEKEVIAVNGPRRSGKTTLLLKLQEKLKQEKKKTVFVNFEDTDNLEAFLKAPKEFVYLNLSSSGKTYFLFDEFQYVKGGGKLLKLVFDTYPQAKFVITGSSSLKIRNIASFLVGRVVFFELYPFSFLEFLSFFDSKLVKLGTEFGKQIENFFQGKKVNFPKLAFASELEKLFLKYLLYGGYPGIVVSEKSKKKLRLDSLIETYVEKDIIKYLKIGNFLEFKKFVRVLAVQVGNIINYSSLAQDTGLSFREIKSFLAVLEQTFVVKTVSPWFTNKITEIRKSPKLYFLDLGLRNALLKDFRSIPLRENKGALAENFVFQNLFYLQKIKNLNFWRTKTKAEVDFILNWQGKPMPVEVKYSQFNKAKLSRSLKSFIAKYKPEKGIVFNKNFTGVLKKDKTQILFLPIYFTTFVSF